jgi:hypothetical protein
MFRCPFCNKAIDDDLIKSEGARLMVMSRPDRQEIRNKHAAARAKIRELSEELEKLKESYERTGNPRKRSAKITSNTKRMD